MVFAEREETISGGNFHGEYPAKVIQHLKKGKKFCFFWFCFLFVSVLWFDEIFFCRLWTIWQLVCMNSLQLVKEELRGSATLHLANCLHF